ncbi:MAG: 2-hydroxyacyl-CoA dehydratase, partial [Deltaproteobacteria bacterium]|nr:2-hydroxyacyl-CoA dehydratase [Deltaproteobacteria bacterium]
MSAELEKCLSAAEKPYEYLTGLKKRIGKPMAGFLSSYIPHEIVYAAGAHPFRIFPSESGFNRSYGFLQPFACSYVRAALEDGLEGRLGFADCMLFSHTCDALQTLEGIWRKTVNVPVAANLNFPTAAGGALQLNFLISQLRDFYGALSIRFNSGDENSLMTACGLYNENRALLRELYGLRREGRLSLTSSEFYKVL